MKTTLSALLISTVFVLSACQTGAQEEAEQVSTNRGHKIIVEEVLQTDSYTYLRFKEGVRDSWLAAAKREAQAGETLYYDDAIEMKNFTSKELQKTFESIYFVSQISSEPLSTPAGQSGLSPNVVPKPTGDTGISVEPAEGSISIEALFSDRKSYANKTVKIRGQVVKFNANIMGKNWVHLQDGSNHSGKFDLTITTKDDVKVGDVVTFKGNVVLDKDFGAGYSYEVILEEGKLLK